MGFADFFPKRFDRLSAEPLAATDYPNELELKERALSLLLKEGSITLKAEKICPSPLPRHYRTTGKRRLTVRGRQLFLHFGRTPGKENVALSELEPESHGKIYLDLYKLLSEPRNRAAAEVMNYCIIRGSYTEHAVIFNVKRLSGEIVRCLKFIADGVVRSNPVVKSVFLYLDEKGSDYYLEAERPVKAVAFKKLYGPEHLALQLDGQKYLYSPTSFSQINESILPDFLNILRQEIASEGAESLLDLYCGYGLWSLALAEHFQKIYGLELAAESIKSARSNATFHYPSKNISFDCGFIDGELLRGKLPPPGGEKERILLDPPRKGCAPGVTEYLISRKPGRILHLFCGADEIVPALKVYEANNCKVEKLLPFDFFPGSMNIELLAVIRCGGKRTEKRRK
ncbi:MAG: class I SAM-dependent RNA methyltransferase [Lentisphaeria bacterium]|nr:class I SAM-dependent RNA methyltransferase [Lentisphaeria bacterium]